MGQSEEGVAGLARAVRQIDELRPRVGEVPASFARIIVGLFPEWFEFAASQFAILAWDRGLQLVVSGTARGLAIFPTSNSRCMSCMYIGEEFDAARMDMHYRPQPEQAERARAVIGLALHRLFPERGLAPIPAGVVVPPGRVFPPTWSGRFADSEPDAVPDRGRITGFWEFIARWRRPAK